MLPYLNSLEAEIYLTQEDLALAEIRYREALKEQPLLYSALLGMSHILLKQKKLCLSLKYAHRAARLSPDEADSYKILGELYELKGSKICLRYYQKFYDLSFMDPEKKAQAKEIQAKLVKLKKNKKIL